MIYILSLGEHSEGYSSNKATFKMLRNSNVKLKYRFSPIRY